MKTLHRLSVTIAVLLSCAACDRQTPVVGEQPTPAAATVAKTDTLETRRFARAVDLYAKEPTAENAADVSRALADLNGEISELQERVANKTGGEREEAAAKLKNLQAYRTAESARFAAAQARAAVPVEPGLPPRTEAQKAGDALKEAGDKIEEGAKKAGDAIEDAARKTGDAVKDAVK